MLAEGAAGRERAGARQRRHPKKRPPETAAPLRQGQGTGLRGRASTTSERHGAEQGARIPQMRRAIPCSLTSPKGIRRAGHRTR